MKAVTARKARGRKARTSPGGRRSRQVRMPRPERCAGGFEIGDSSGASRAARGEAAEAAAPARRPVLPVVVAFSGGVDSSLLLAAAVEACGDGVLAVTASSPPIPRRELENARRIAALLGAGCASSRPGSWTIPPSGPNPLDRCYHCKRELFAELKRLGRGRRATGPWSRARTWTISGISGPVRGRSRELAVASPLQAGRLHQGRRAGRSRARIGLPNWDKPAAACLASRFPYGTEITREGLARIERIEDALLDLGFGQVRARCHGDLVRHRDRAAGLARAVRPKTRDEDRRRPRAGRASASWRSTSRATGPAVLTLEIGTPRP